MDEVEQSSNAPDNRPPLGPNFFSPAQSVDETPIRRTRPLSMLSYNPPTLPGTPSPANLNHHSRQPSLSSARPLIQPSGTPSKRSSRWTLIVLPPASLPHSPPPPHVSGFAHGYGASGRYSSGLLLPLQPTLTLQLASIAREFSLPSTGGLTLHLSISGANEVVQPGPRITDDSWVVLFSWAFEENPSSHCGLQPSTGLPIAARVEFDIDMRKARWFEAWASAAQPNMHRPSLTKVPPKLSTASVPLLRPRAQEAPSSTNTGVRTLMISTSRRSSTKTIGSSWPEELLGPDRQPLVSDQDPHRARSTIAPSEISLESPSPESEFHQLSHPDAQSDHQAHNDRLERLTEEALTDGDLAPDSGQVVDSKWELQQYALMKQAALERERIELADLEEEKLRQQAETLEHEKLCAERTRNEEKEAERAAAHARLQADEEARNAPDKVVTQAGVEPNKTQVRQAIEPPTKAAQQQQLIENTNIKANKPIALAASGIATIALAASGAAALVISSPQTPPRERRANTDVGADQQHRGATSSEPGPPSSTFSTILGRSVGRFSGEQELLKRRSQTAQSSAAGKRLLDEMDKVVQEKALVKEATFLSSTRRAVSDDGLLSPVLVKETPKTPPPLPTRSKVIELAKAFAAEDRRPVGVLPPSSRQLSRSQERPTGLARSPTNPGQPMGSASEPAGLTSKSLPQTPAFTEALFKAKDTQEVPPALFPLMQTEFKAVVGKETNTPQSAAYPEQTGMPVSENADVQEACLPQTFLAARGSSETVDHEEPEWPRTPIYVTHMIEQTYETADTEQVPLSQTSAMHSAFESTGDEETELPRGPVLVEQTIEEIYEIADGQVDDVPKTPLSDEQKQVGRPFEKEPQSPDAVEQQQEQPPPLPTDPTPSTTQDPLAPMLHAYDSDASLSEDLAEYIVRAQEDALERHNKFVVAVSGGSLAKLMAGGLLGHPDVKWDSWKVFFADERIVPLDSEHSNFGTMMKALFSHVPIDRSQIVSIMGLPPDDMDLDEMAPVISSIYEAQVLEELDLSATGCEELPRFDLVLLGMGDDGHTCSLFPSHRLLDDNEGVVNWLNDSPKPPAHRITLGLAVLNAAHDAAFVCTGSTKDSMLAAVLEQESSSVRPASLVKLGHRPVAWFVDDAAAASTCYPRSQYGSGAARSIQDEAPGLTDGSNENRSGPVAGAVLLRRSLASEDDDRGAHALTNAALAKANLEQEADEASEDGHVARSTSSGAELTSSASEQVSRSGRMNGGNLEQSSGLVAATDRGSLRGESEARAWKASEEPCSELGVGDRWHDARLVNANAAPDGLISTRGTEASSSPTQPEVGEEGLEQVYHESCAVQPGQPKNTAHVASDSTASSETVSTSRMLSSGGGSHGTPVIESCSLASEKDAIMMKDEGSVRSLAVCSLENGIKDPVYDIGQPEEVNCQPKHVPAPLQTFSGPDKAIGLAYQASGDADETFATESYPHVVQPISPEEVTELGPMYHADDDALVSRGVRAFEPSLQYSSQVEQDQSSSRGPAVGVMALEMSGSNLSEAFYGKCEDDGLEESQEHVMIDEGQVDPQLAEADDQSDLSSPRVSNEEGRSPVVLLHSSPVAILASRLADSFYPDDHQALASTLPQAVRTYSPSVQYTTLPKPEVEAAIESVDGQRQGGGALGLDMQPSALSGAFFGQSEVEESAVEDQRTKKERIAIDQKPENLTHQSQKTEEKSEHSEDQPGFLSPLVVMDQSILALHNSPVMILPATLADSFYPDGQQALSGMQAVRTFPPSLQYIQKVEAEDAASRRSPAAGELALRMPASALSGAFFGQSGDVEPIAQHLVTNQRTVDQQAEPEHHQSTFLSHLPTKKDRSLPLHSSPVAILSATLADSFYPDEQQALTGAQAVRGFSPSLQYTQKVDAEDAINRSPAVGALALYMPASALSGAFFGKSETVGTIAEDLVTNERKVDTQAEPQHPQSSDSSSPLPCKDKSLVALSSSPVAVLPATLVDSFYPDEQALAGTQAVRGYSPSTQYTQEVTAEVAGRGPAAEALQLDMAASALSGASCARKEAPESTTEHLAIKEPQLNQDAENRHRSDSSPPLSSKVGSPSQSQWPSRQLTDEEWPPTPPSPHRQSSTDLTGGILTLDSELTISVGLNEELKPEFSKCVANVGVPIQEQSSTSQLITQDNETEMSTLAEASQMTPMISQFHPAHLDEEDGAVCNPETLAALTPKASLCGTPDGNNDSALDRPSSADIKTVHLDQEDETKKITQDVLGLNVEIPKPMVEVDRQVAQISLADASLITPSIEEFHRTGLTKDSHGRAVNQMRTLSEMDSIDMACEPTSPGRLPSPSLMDRVTFTPGQTVAVLKQFPDYGLTSTLGNAASSQGADKIEVDKHTRQISLSDASQLSPSLLAPRDTDHSDVVVKEESGSQAHSVYSEHLDDGSPEPLPTGPENQMKSLKDMDSMDMAIEPASPGRLASADLSSRLMADQVNESSNESQFPAYGSYIDSPRTSPAYIEADVMERRMSMAAAGEITPSIAEFHRAASAELLPGDEPTSPFFLNKDEQAGEFEETEGADESAIYAISTDHAEPGPAQKRQLSTTEHRSYSDRLSMIRPSSPTIPPLNLTINFSDSHSGESTVETEEDVNGGLNVYDEVEHTPSEHSSFEPNGSEFDENRLHELTVQSAVMSSSAGSAGEGEAPGGPWLVEPGQAISGEELPMIATHPPAPLVMDEQSVPEIVASTMDEDLPPPPPPILLPFPSEAEIGEALAQFVFEAQEAAFQRHGKFKVALGGSLLAQILGDGIVADDRIQWQYWEVFLVEEAIAPIGAAESTFSTLMNSVLQHVPIPREQIHSIAELTKADVEEASGIATGMDSLTDSLADDYETTLLQHFPEASHETGQAPRFDLILVGLGENGQVGSLYASHPLLGEGDWFVAWLGDAPEGPSHRITLTLPVLNAAHQFAFVATGEKVAGIVAEALERSVQSDVPMEEDREVPSALVKTDRRPIVWFTDLAAAAVTDYTKSAFWDED